MITTLDLFAGIGGFSLGLEATGFFRTTCFVENEPYCQAVLKHHWPDVPVLGDIRDVRREDLPDPNPGLICGGFPCQPFSHAGKQRAQDDPRHLWPEMFRLIRECRPTWIVGENVTGLIKLGLDEVLSDLEGEGYATRTFNIPACAVGAPHLRQRLWIVAHSDSESEPDGAFDGNTGQRQLGFGWSEATSHGSDSNEPRSHQTKEYEYDSKYREAKLRDKQVRESGSVGGDVADAQRKGKGRRRLSGPGKDKSENSQGPSDKSRGYGETLADADSNDGGRRRGTKSQGREARLEYRSGSARQFERQPQPDVAHTKSGVGWTREKSQQSEGHSPRKSLGDGGADVADTKKVHGQGSDIQGSQQRQDKGSLGECGTVVADTKRQRGRGGYAQRQDAKNAGQPSRNSRHDARAVEPWTVEPNVGRVAHGIPNRVSQLRSLGNSIIPQIAEEIGNAIHAAETQ